MGNLEFETRIIESVKNAMLKQVTACQFIEYHHKNKKYVPDDIVEKAWEGLNWDFIISEVKNKLEERLINVISGNMINEAGTDAKKLLSISGVREKLRAEAYPKIKAILDNHK